jgi:hypothetical protein
LDESHCASIAASCLSHMTIAVTRLSQPDGRLRRANRGERIETPWEELITGCR